MSGGVPLAWRQLFHQPLRLFAAVCGITFAVVLMLVQLGFQDALLSSSGLHYSHMTCDLALVSPLYEFMVAPGHFPKQRLYQCLEVDGVASAIPVYVSEAPWKNPWKRTEHSVFAVGFPPLPGYWDMPGVDSRIADLREGAQALFDSRSRTEFGPVAAATANGRPLTVEIAGHRVDVVGTFSLGTSFGANGTVLMSDRTFLRTLPFRNLDQVDYGLVKLKPGFDAEKVRARLAAVLPKDVQVFTRQGLINLERRYWETYTPIGFVFSLGVLMGMFVGCIIVYQILYNDVSEHLAEYATLKAMGYANSYLFWVVIQEAVILSLFGFVPGLGISVWVYRFAGDATMLTLRLPFGRIVLVYLLTTVMCIISGALVVKKVYRADPAEIF
jgi:putative ABC transport system permease protein